MIRLPRVRISPPFLCPVGIMIVAVAKLILAIGDTALSLRHGEPLYLILVLAEILELSLFTWKSYRLFQTARLPRVHRRRRKAAAVPPVISDSKIESDSSADRMSPQGAEQIEVSSSHGRD
ncbi:MAG: hypothetical protein JWN86_1838 [Planctomycetota bacterium]|nr:hypothetical protein [Planctomycetota bacterium]